MFVHTSETLRHPAARVTDMQLISDHVPIFIGLDLELEVPVIRWQTIRAGGKEEEAFLSDIINALSAVAHKLLTKQTFWIGKMTLLMLSHHLHP